MDRQLVLVISLPLFFWATLFFLNLYLWWINDLFSYDKWEMRIIRSLGKYTIGCGDYTELLLLQMDKLFQDTWGQGECFPGGESKILGPVYSSQFLNNGRPGMKQSSDELFLRLKGVKKNRALNPRFASAKAQRTLLSKLAEFNKKKKRGKNDIKKNSGRWRRRI